jgi:hypothetical protein
MLFLIAASLAALALLALAIRPGPGFLTLIVSKPVIDTAFYKVFAFNLSVTRSVALGVPFLVFLNILRAPPAARLSRMPLRRLWLAYVSYIFLFSSLTVAVSGIPAGLEVFFRHIHGFVGFYMMQAFFHEPVKLRRLLLAFVVAGVFPTTAGLYQMLTGETLSPLAGGDMVEGLQRSVGFYHDVFTIRYYSFQTLLAILLYTALFPPRNPAVNVLLFGYALLTVAVMFKAYSKSGLVCLALWTVIWTVSQRKFVLLALGAGAAALVALYFADSIVLEIGRIFRKEIGALGGNVALEQTFEGRWIGWQTRFDAWQGLDTLQQFIGSGVPAIGAHNDYLQMLFHGGLFGLTLYVTLLLVHGFLILRNLRERADPLRIGALMVWVMYVIDTIGLVPSSYVGYQWLVWGIIGLSFRMRSDDLARRALPAAKP